MKVMLLMFCLCALLPIHALAENPKIIRMPLTHIKSGLQQMADRSIHPKIIEPMLYDFVRQGPSNGSYPVPLFKYLDSEFYGEILIGHPGRSFKVAIDTTFDFNWVTSVLCPITSLPCAFRDKYNPNESSTSKSLGIPFNVSYDSGVLAGKYWKDLYHVNQVNVTDQIFVSAYYLPFELIWAKADGAAGLSGEMGDAGPSLFLNMVNQKMLQQNIFSLYLNRDPGTQKGGTLLFGAYDNKHYRGNITWINSSKSWSFNLNRITASDNKKNITLCPNGCEAILDSSSNMIEGPADDIESLNLMIQAKKFYFGRYSVECGIASRLPPVNFIIGGTTFVLKSSDYIQKLRYGPVTVCLSSFANNSPAQSSTWYLGGAFISKFYSICDYDKSRVGFAIRR